MARGRLEAQWDIGAAVLAMIHNTNCANQSQTRPPRYFHPFARPEPEPPPPSDTDREALRRLFPGDRTTD